MSSEPSAIPTKICPTCGTRVSEDAARCLVCGADLGTAAKPAQPAKAVTGSRMPVLTLSLPAAIGLLVLFLTIGAVMVYFASTQAPQVVAEQPTATGTSTLTPTASATPTSAPPTQTSTPEPTLTPIVHIVQPGETCLGIAGFFDVSVNSIVMANGLSVDCVLSPNQELLIPQPTATPTQLPTATFSEAEMTEQACEKTEYTVQAGDALSTIANVYGVSMAAIKEENGLTSDNVNAGMKLVIPLCMRPTQAGPTPTPTPLPPYPAPALLLPADGAPFTLSDENISLQWAAVGTLKENEAYAVTVEDVTEGLGRRVVAYVTETKYILSPNFRPKDRTPHVLRWWVLTVRQTGTTEDGDPIWEPAGASSPQRTFTWTGAGSSTPEP